MDTKNTGSNNKKMLSITTYYSTGNNLIELSQNVRILIHRRYSQTPLIKVKGNLQSLLRM